MRLLQMSFSGAILIIVVVVIRAAAVNKLPKKIFLILWGIVLLKLIVPFSIPSMLSVYSFVNQRIPANIFDGTPTVNIVPAMQKETFQLTGEIQPLSINHGLSVSIWFVIWLIGMILYITFFVIVYLRCRFEFQASLPIQNGFVNQWLKEHKLKRSISIRQSDRVSSPLTYGILKPVILMPKKTDWEHTKQLQYVFLHEYLHICHYDTATKLIAALALCIHWFNPFVWIMFILFNRDIELACDESVVRQYGETSKADYSLMLISMEARKSEIFPLCNNFSKNAIEERITAIMKTRKVSLGIIIISVAIIASIAIFFATSAEKQEQQMIFVMERVWVSTQEDVSEEVAKEAEISEYDSPFIGFIKTTVDKKQIPNEEMQSNFGYIGAEIVFNGSGIAVYTDGKWMQFEQKEQTSAAPTKDNATPVTAALIKGFSLNGVILDIVEFVTDDDVERKAELIEELTLTEGNDLIDGDFMDGYYIYNLDSDTTEFMLSNETIFTFIDWDYKYTELDYPDYYSTTDKEIFMEYIGACDTTIPFFFEIEDGIIKSITEQPIP